VYSAIPPLLIFTKRYRIAHPRYGVKLGISAKPEMSRETGYGPLKKTAFKLAFSVLL
jgi:hypothetical protein